MRFFLYLFAPFRRGKAIAAAHAAATSRDMGEVRFYKAVYSICELAHHAVGNALDSLTVAKTLLATRFELTNWLLRDHRESDIENIRGQAQAARAQLLAALAVMDTVLQESDSYIKRRELPCIRDSD